MSKKDSIISNEQVLEWAKSKYDILEHECYRLGEVFSEYLNTFNKDLQPIDKSTLGIRTRRKSDYALSVQWIWVRFFKDSHGKWFPRTREITKGTGTQTPIINIHRRANGYEMDEVKKVEYKLSIIRKELVILRRIVANIRFLQSIEEQLESKVLEK